MKFLAALLAAASLTTASYINGNTNLEPCKHASETNLLTLHSANVSPYPLVETDPYKLRLNGTAAMPLTSTTYIEISVKHHIRKSIERFNVCAAIEERGGQCPTRDFDLEVGGYFPDFMSGGHKGVTVRVKDERDEWDWACWRGKWEAEKWEW
ncbi:hypothetical protein PRZ48_008929 [Zasmidium cellare]|uniref:MD-2-related lipid-recognition domain-containing protein n=1 Tax=Zasmidium cellare TaxID=395010 RepID=A0ABR0EGW8_ZASCE|nr:hypothetical protein PRZ48_008929 [Zasmidium cellare]